MADQCIVCLENLDAEKPTPPLQPPPESLDQADPATLPLEPAPTDDAVPQPPVEDPVGNDGATNHSISSPENSDDNLIAVIQVCGHVLHDSCLRAWTGKANSCPICRQDFHNVDVYDKVGGTLLSSYEVQDKKQIAEFDHQAFLDENPDVEEEIRPCPICGLADHEEVLLLCDSCDAAYHTYCVDLTEVPRGHWFCMECAVDAADLLRDELDEADPATGGLSGFTDSQSDYLPRTQATMRRARQRERSDEWSGAWGQIAGHVWDAIGFDLDNHDDEEALHSYRQIQQRQERDRREYLRWQQRLSIASRLGAREVFAENIAPVLPQRLARRPQAPPPPPPENPEVTEAWGALELAMDAEFPRRQSENRQTQDRRSRNRQSQNRQTDNRQAHSRQSPIPQAPTRQSPNHRKRKSRSVTASPVDPPPPQERRLKRPRTRRVPMQSEASSSTPTPGMRNGQSASAAPASNSGHRPSRPSAGLEGPSFLSSLLKEVEMSTPSDDETIQMLLAAPNFGMDPQSPVMSPSMSPGASPSPSAHGSPRLSSMTPPPRGINERPGSPLSLSSRIEPIYPPANYTVARNGGDSDQESRPRHVIPHHFNGNHFTTEIRQPRPRRQQEIPVGTNGHHRRSPESSPARPTLSMELKQTLSGIVKDALRPHWKSGHLTADQYANINRDLSHKLYREVSDSELSEESRSRVEKIANKEVTRAVEDLRTSSGGAVAVV